MQWGGVSARQTAASVRGRHEDARACSNALELKAVDAPVDADELANGRRACQHTSSAGAHDGRGLNFDAADAQRRPVVERRLRARRAVWRDAADEDDRRISVRRECLCAVLQRRRRRVFARKERADEDERRLRNAVDGERDGQLLRDAVRRGDLARN